MKKIKKKYIIIFSVVILLILFAVVLFIVSPSLFKTHYTPRNTVDVFGAPRSRLSSQFPADKLEFVASIGLSSHPIYSNNP